MSRRWRVVLLRAKGDVLGTVEAPDMETAKAVAAVQFELDDVQRDRSFVEGALRPGPMPGEAAGESASTLRRTIARDRARPPFVLFAFSTTAQVPLGGPAER
jgi:hypothetical protein